MLLRLTWRAVGQKLGIAGRHMMEIRGRLLSAQTAQSAHEQLRQRSRAPCYQRIHHPKICSRPPRQLHQGHLRQCPPLSWTAWLLLERLRQRPRAPPLQLRRGYRRWRAARLLRPLPPPRRAQQPRPPQRLLRWHRQLRHTQRSAWKPRPVASANSVSRSSNSGRRRNGRRAPLPRSQRSSGKRGSAPRP